MWAVDNEIFTLAVGTRLVNTQRKCSSRGQLRLLIYQQSQQSTDNGGHNQTMVGTTHENDNKIKIQTDNQPRKSPNKGLSLIYKTGIVSTKVMKSDFHHLSRWAHSDLLV